MAVTSHKATPGTLEWIPVKDLNFGPENPYQRPIKEAWLEYLVNNWNPDIAGVLEISKREDGTLWVKEGQHRCSAKVRRGEIDDAMACHVMIHQSLATEARNAREMNQMKKSWTAYDIYNAELQEGHEGALGLKAILDRLGIVVSAGASSEQVLHGGLLFSVASAMNLYRRQGGPEMTERVFQILHDAFSDSQHSYNSTILKGLALFLSQHDGIDDEEVSKSLRRSSTPDELLYQARQMKKRGRWALSAYLAMSIEGVFNWKRGEKSRVRETAAVTYAVALKKYERNFEPATAITAEVDDADEVIQAEPTRRRHARR